MRSQRRLRVRLSRRALLITGLALTAALTAPAGAGALTARGSVEQVQVSGVRPGARVTLVGGPQRHAQTRRAGSLGGVIFRHVAPATGYRVRTHDQHVKQSGRLRVLSRRSAPPSTRTYRQRLPAGGYGYLTTRDGTRLAVNVRLPGPATRGPYPTLVEYSGYGYADPDGSQNSIAPLASLLGFAVVDVNMRGTGCSGGGFDFFEPLQSLDGYDVVETAARQPWALHHRVGMMGISYGGISQLFVAATRPPSLAAIAPLSVIDATSTTLYPGGILNTGFASTFARERDHDAKPASATGGQAWALKRIRGGDAICKSNQALHPEGVDLLAETRALRFDAPLSRSLDLTTFVHRIRAPVFLACQWTDEQTGGDCPRLSSQLTGTRRHWSTFTNGTHIDSLDPATLMRWFDFLELYVARRAPLLPDAVRSGASEIFQTAMGIPGVTLPDDPIQSLPTYADALAAFDRQPAVRVLFESGGGGTMPGDPVPTFEQSFARFPVPDTSARTWYLGAGGALSSTPSATSATDRLTLDPGSRPAKSFAGDLNAGPGGLWTAMPAYDWLPNPPGTAATYTTAPLAEDTTVIGGGTVALWIKASAPSVDVQATIGELGPDGLERFVQNGWLATSQRKLDPRTSTPLAPVLSRREADTAPLHEHGWTKVTIPLYQEGHVYHAGSRLRVTVSAPGGDQPQWAFTGTQSGHGRPTVSIASSAARPSHVVLPVVAGVTVPTSLPACASLRGEPCRTG
jgi:uncharacterized protein